MIYDFLKMKPITIAKLPTMPYARRSIPRKRKTSTAAALSIIFIFQNIYAEEPKSKNISTGFSEQALMTCGKLDIAVTTSCLEKSNGAPSYCFSQNVSFIAIGEEVVSSVNYKHSFKGGNQPFVDKISCLNYRNEIYVRIENTDFGNCKICEWADIFSQNGKYIGSTPGIYNSGDFLPIALPSQLRELLSPDHPGKIVHENSEIHIYRAR